MKWHIEWRPIPGFSQYEINNFGRVRSYVRAIWESSEPKPLRGRFSSGGHVCVSLRGDDGAVKTIGVHILVMLTFVGPRPVGMWVLHFDDNPRNNHLSNLRYDTPAANGADRLRNAKRRREEEHRKKFISKRYRP